MPDNPRLIHWRNLPMELRLKKQWVVASPNKAPLFFRDNQFYNASVSKHASSQWMSFEDATTAAIIHSLNIGFIIAEGDGITCIDLDVKPNTTKETMDRFQLVVKQFDSYTERSVGGHGIHIWCKGDIGLGRRRDGVEIYSQNRFMICTGNVLHLKEHLEPRQEMLNNMVTQMPLSADYSEIVLEDLPQVRTDEEVGRDLWEIEDARMLWQGNWQDLGHPSQSEADLDIIIHLVRLSPSNEQVYRLFRQSNLGKRNKANRKDYVDRTMRHARFIRQQELVDIEAGKRITDAILAKYDAEHPTPQPTSQGSAAVAIDSIPEVIPYETPKSELKFEPKSQLELDFYTFPPGGLGYLARHFYKGSYHPNVLFATAMSIVTISAICGRAWNTSTHLGLNTYNLIIAPSGMGKEDLSKGIMRLIAACKMKYPNFDRFFYFGRFTAGTSLIKHFGSIHMKQPSGMSCAQIATEFSDTISRFATGRDENMQGLMMTMLDLHSKAAPGSMSSAITYSDQTKNVISLESPAYSILGETTPEVYEKLTDFLLSNGFLSRFNIMEYRGQRPPVNENPDFSIDENLNNFLIMLAKIADEIYRTKKLPIVAKLTPEAQTRYHKFRSFCHNNYNISITQTSSNVEHNLWARSPARVIVLATLAAIADSNPLENGVPNPPIVTEEHLNWAEEFVRRDINDFKTKQEAGDLGSGDAVCVKKIETWLDEYLSPDLLKKYSKVIKTDYQASGKISLSYIRYRALQTSCFKLNKEFSQRKLEEAIQTLIRMGRLREIKDPIQKMGTSGALYQIHTG